MILLYSVAAGLSAKPSLQEGLTSLRNLKDNRAAGYFTMRTFGQEIDFFTRHNPQPTSASGWQLFSHSLSLEILSLHFSLFILFFIFEDFAATDLASTYVKNYNTFFPTMRLISSREFFHLLKPLKRFHTLLSSLYKSSVEEDSRRSDILQPDSNANSLLQKLALVFARSSQRKFSRMQRKVCSPWVIWPNSKLIWLLANNWNSRWCNFFFLKVVKLGCQGWGDQVWGVVCMISPLWTASPFWQSVWVGLECKVTVSHVKRPRRVT